MADIEEVIKTRVSLEQEFRRHHGLRVRLEGRMEVKGRKGMEEGKGRRLRAKDGRERTKQEEGRNIGSPEARKVLAFFRELL